MQQHITQAVHVQCAQLWGVEVKQATMYANSDQPKVSTTHG